MKSKEIPLWITLSDIHLKLRLSVYQSVDSVPSCESDEISETFGYEISGTGELSRIIELNLNTQNGRENTVERFNKLLLSIRAHRKSEKKYSGHFIYSIKDQVFKNFNNQLTLYLNVPEVTFNNFCREIASKNIHNLVVGISLNGEEDNSVGRFGPPSVDDIISLTTDDFMFDSNVRLTSLDANFQVHANKETKKDDEFKL